MIKKDLSRNGTYLTTTLSGDVDTKEIMDDFQSMFTMAGDINPAGLCHLYDMENVESFDVSEEDIRRMSTHALARQGGGSQISVVTAIVATDPKCQKLAQLHKELSELLGLKEVEVFDCRDAATSWLGERYNQLYPQQSTA
ncbi:MAG: hypothetical protein ACWA5Q_04420 [bacterium]